MGTEEAERAAAPSRRHTRVGQWGDRSKASHGQASCFGVAPQLASGKLMGFWKDSSCQAKGIAFLSRIKRKDTVGF